MEIDLNNRNISISLRKIVQKCLCLLSPIIRTWSKLEAFELWYYRYMLKTSWITYSTKILLNRIHIDGRLINVIKVRKSQYLSSENPNTSTSFHHYRKRQSENNQDRTGLSVKRLHQIIILICEYKQGTEGKRQFNAGSEPLRWDPLVGRNTQGSLPLLSLTLRRLLRD